MFEVVTVLVIHCPRYRLPPVGVGLMSDQRSLGHLIYRVGGTEEWKPNSPGLTSVSLSLGLPIKEEVLCESFLSHVDPSVCLKGRVKGV